MKNKKYLFVLGATDNLAFATAVTIQSIKDNFTKEPFDILLFENDFTEANKKALSKIHSIRFEPFHFPSGESEQYKRYTSLAFSRYHCFDLLNEYENVAWSDVDVLVNRNINHIFDLPQSGLALFKYPGYYFDISFAKDFLSLSKNEVIFYASGLIIINRKLNGWDKMTHTLFNLTQKFHSYGADDQKMLNIEILHKNLPVTNLEIAYCCPPAYRENAKNAYILHPWGHQKFWHRPNWNAKWYKYYKKWISLGGAPYPDYKPMSQRIKHFNKAITRIGRNIRIKLGLKKIKEVS